MDPDKDTVSSQPQLGRKELLRSEHQLLLLVERLLDKANYFQVSPPKQFFPSYNWVYGICDCYIV